jgi:chromosome segregation ATPase
MLQDMQKKIAEEGKRDAALFDKFMCYCKTGSASLEASIKAAETKIPQIDSALKESEALLEQLKGELKQHKQDRADAKEAVAKADGIRQKEAAAFAKFSADNTANIAALGKAIAAISKGQAGFLQTSAASVLRQLTVDMDMSSVDRDVLSSFLSEGNQYAPQSGQILGILKQMKDTMEADLAEAEKNEKEAIAGFNGMVAAKEKEIRANSKAIEAKTKREGEVGVEIVNLKEDLDDTQKALAEDQQFLADLSKNCATADADYEVVKKTRAE